MTKAEREEKLRLRFEELSRIERELRAQGICVIAGVDEVGRGPLAGPVTAACVALPEDFRLLGVDDSKKLSEKKREELSEGIRERALAFGIGSADSLRIDEINILEATKEAMEEAVKRCMAGLSEKGLELQELLIDALTLPRIALPQRGIIKGDATSVSIAAASIVAKVSRDALMVRYAEKYPGYAFEKNKGYGTAEHYRALREMGPCPIHRRSFLKGL